VEPGRLLNGRYRITGPAVAEGSVGVVWPAVDASTGERLAAKAVHAQWTRSPTAVEALRAATGRRPHPVIAAPRAVFAEDGVWWVVSDWVDGPTLAEREAPLLPLAACALGAALADALAARHRAGKAHGDIRPGTVHAEGAVRIRDDGRGAPAGARDAWTGRAGQTAPEVLAGAPASATADLYGLGVVLFRATTGRWPFPGPTPWASVAAQRRRTPPPHGVPAGLAGLIAALLEPDPARRPDDARAVAAAFRRLAQDPTRPVSGRAARAPALRWSGAWTVHGIDLGTGARCRVRAGVSRRRALTLVARLRAEGWEVQADREALVAVDLVFPVAGALIGGLAVPVVGAPLGAIVGLLARAQGCRPELAGLPPVRTPVPPVAVTASEPAVVAGILLLVAAAVALWLPWGAAVLLAAVLAFAVWAVRRPPPPPSPDPGAAWIEAQAASLRALLDRSRLPLDRALGFEGELRAIEDSWRVGERSPSAASSSLLALAERLRAVPEIASHARESTGDVE